MANIAKAAVGALGALAIAKTYFGPKSDDLSITGRDASKLSGSVSEIRSEALNVIGIARSTRGSISFLPPGPVSNYAAGEVARMMAFYATDFNIPGAVINTTSVRRYGAGIATKYPTGVSLPDITVTFIVDGQGLIQKFFHNWISSISNFDTRLNDSATARYYANMFEVGYKKDMSGRAFNTTTAYLQINSENASSITATDPAPPIITYEVSGLYPIAVSDINMSWASSSGLATITVKFAYDYYAINADADLSAKPFDTTLPSMSGLQQVVRGATVVQTVSALKRPRNVSDIISVVNNTAMIASIMKKW